MSLALFDLTGKRALVTGSSQGIGLALARALASAGAEVVLNGRTQAKLNAVAAEFAQAGWKARTTAFDVTDEAATNAAIAALVADLGPIDILVNNTGMQYRKPLEEFETAMWHTLMNTNLTSVFYVSRAVVNGPQGMIARRSGKIINVCSVQSEAGRYSIAPYAATKGGLKMLTKGMCIDWARHGIQVNGLGPGYFETELTKPLVENAEFTAWLKNRTPAQRWGQVSELGGAAIFLASAAANFVNGHVLYVDGGMLASI